MTTTTATPAHDFYDPDAVIPQNSPILVPKQVNTRPSPSPEIEFPPDQASSPFSHDGKLKRRKVEPSQGDEILLNMMGDGRDPSVAAQGGMRPLPSEEDDVTSPGSDGCTDEAEDTNTSPDQPPADYTRRPELPPSPPNDLKMLADGALAKLTLTHRSVRDDDGISKKNGDTAMEASRTAELAVFPAARSYTGPRNDRPHPVFPTPYSPASIHTPGTGSFASPTASLGPESLPPMQTTSPRSASNVAITLPSLIDQVGADALSPPIAHSPPGHMYHGINRLPSMSHASPPISPHELNPRSPHQHIIPPSPYPPWPPYAMSHRASVDYNGSTPSDHGSTPGTTGAVADRMSIEGMAFSNSPGEHGLYICDVEGCNAPPFQTQYLLSSHRNVHSQARPHYCPVAGCPRAEGGKGFKRKNEMIRHGLVHESPGYVCPYCPDREHKYPRPDNLQRHVRVHHPEKDKDDNLLREVLSQRSDGPSRGRRRRGNS